VPAPPPVPETSEPESGTNAVEATAEVADIALPQAPEEPVILPQEGPLGEAQVHSALFQEAEPQVVAVPEAMRRVQKCVSCGFPVSAGRTLCLDCENKSHGEGKSAEVIPPEFVPAFLASSPPPSESWLANHVNVLAVVVLILSIVVAIVVFR